MSASRPHSARAQKTNGTHTPTSTSGNSTPRTPNDTSASVTSSITSASRPTTATRSTSRPTSAKTITPQRSPSNAALIRGSGTTTPLSTSTSDSTAVALVSPRLASTTSIPGTIVAPEVIPRGALTLGVRPAIEEISRVRSNHRASTRAFLAHLQREIDQLAISLHDDGDSEDENDETMLQQLIEMRTAMENKMAILDQQRDEELNKHKKEVVQAHTRAKLSHQEVRSLQALQRDLVKAGGDPVMLQHVTQFTNYRQEEERRRKYDEYIAKRVQKPTPSRALRDDSSSAPIPALTSPSSSSLSTTTTVIRPRPDTDPAAIAARERQYMEKQAQIRRDEREHKRLEEERRLRELTRQREKREAEAKERYEAEMERRRKAEAELDIKMKAEEEEEKSAVRLASEIAALKEQEWEGEEDDQDEEEDVHGEEHEPYLDDDEEPEPEDEHEEEEHVKAAPPKSSSTTKSPRPHPAGEFSPRPKPGKMTFAAEAPVTSSNQRFVRAKMRHAVGRK